MTIASVLSHLVVRPRLFYKINEKKMKKEINNDLAIVASQMLEGQFMTVPSSLTDSSTIRTIGRFNTRESMPVEIPEHNREPLYCCQQDPFVSSICFPPV